MIYDSNIFWKKTRKRFSGLSGKSNFLTNIFFFLTHNLADLLKLARKMGALIQEPYHSGPHTKTMILLAVQPNILLASKQHFHPLLAGQLGDVVARRHRLLALVASFGVLQTSPPIINTPGAKK